MTKAELIEKICDKAGLGSKSLTESALNATIASLTEALTAGDAVNLTGFGTFKVSERGSRKGRNPRTGESIDIPACKIVRFLPGKTLKERVK